MSEAMDSMNDLDDQLEARLSRLEAGEPLEACVVGLPSEEADLVWTADLLRTIPLHVEGPSPERAAQLRREFLRSAERMRRPLPTLPTLDRPTNRPRRWGSVLPGLAVAGVVAAFLCVVTAVSLGGLLWFQGQQPPLPVAQASPATRPASTGVPTPTLPGVPPTALALLPPDAQSGMLRDVRGWVEVQGSDGAWAPGQEGQLLRAGQRLRTHNLSSVTIAYFDGSRTELGPGSDLSVDSLDAPAAGARSVVLTQWLGESRHAVTPSSAPGSRFQIITPAGQGTARGTSFHVSVSPALLVRFDVDDGAVDVTHLDVTVSVVAGQSSIVTVDQPPSAPAFLVSGEGLLQEVGATWRIAERSFVTHPNTLVVGDPQVGDWVSFQGRVIADGARVLDKVVLLRRANQTQFALVGQVTAIGAGEWTIAGQIIRVDERTQIDTGLVVGDWVQVAGGIGQDGAWWAASIQRRVDPGDALNFFFVGVVQAQAETTWTVSGISVAISPTTEIEAGLAIGDIVAVAGHLTEDERWLATRIRRVRPSEGAFDIFGRLNSLEPLMVDGIRLVTADWTVMDEELAVGDLVHAQGRILDDGTWLAERITRLDPAGSQPFEFTGRVTAMDPWIIGGLPIDTDAATLVDVAIEIGDLVRVTGEILPDGAWLAHAIRLRDSAVGCLDLRSVVVEVNGSHIVLLDGQVINLEGVTVDGQLQIASVIVIYGCVAVDGQFAVITIIVIFQLGELPVLTPTPQPTVSAPDGDKVTLCHRPPGNPNNAHTITVGASAVPAHLAHGDTLGPCD